MTPMCDTTTGAMVGWAIGTADCDGVIALEYFDEDGLSQGGSLPAGWKPCVQGEDGPAWTPTLDTLAYAATVNIDMNADEFYSIDVSGDLELTGSNYTAARTISVRLAETGGLSRALTFPADWVFLGTEPTTLAANATAQLTIKIYGAAATDAVVSYEVTS